MSGAVHATTGPPPPNWPPGWHTLAHCGVVVRVDQCSRWWPTVTCGNCLRTTASTTATDTSTWEVQP